MHSKFIKEGTNSVCTGWQKFVDLDKCCCMCPVGAMLPNFQTKNGPVAERLQTFVILQSQLLGGLEVVAATTLVTVLIN